MNNEIVGTPNASLKFSTTDVPPRQRREFLHEVLARDLMGAYIVPQVVEEDFYFDLGVHLLPGGSAVCAAKSPLVHSAREREHLGDGRDDYWLFLFDQAGESSADGGAVHTVRPGDLLISDMGRRCTFVQSGYVLAMKFDRNRLTAVAPRIEKDGLHVLPSSAPGLSLLAGYSELLCNALPADETMRRFAENHLYSLAGLVLNGYSRDGAVQAAGGIKAARLALVKRDIAERLFEPELTVEAVAARQGISPQYLRALFNTEGTSFANYVREQRLDHARLLLVDPRYAGMRISAIAYYCGFGDLSYFNRVFRGRYGMTPSEARTQAQTFR